MLVFLFPRIAKLLQHGYQYHKTRIDITATQHIMKVRKMADYRLHVTSVFLHGLCDISLFHHWQTIRLIIARPISSDKTHILHSVIVSRTLTNILVVYGDSLCQTKVLELIKTEWMESNYRSVLCQLSEGKSHHYALNVSARFNITC